MPWMFLTGVVPHFGYSVGSSDDWERKEVDKNKINKLKTLGSFCVMCTGKKERRHINSRKSFNCGISYLELSDLLLAYFTY